MPSPIDLAAAVGGLNASQNDVGISRDAVTSSKLREALVVIRAAQRDAVHLQGVVTQADVMLTDVLSGSLGAFDDLSGDAIQVVTVRNSEIAHDVFSF